MRLLNAGGGAGLRKEGRDNKEEKNGFGIRSVEVKGCSG